MSKFSLEVLERCVFPYIYVRDADIILSTQFGEDVSLTRIRDGILVSHVDPIVGAVKDIGWLAVHVACNDIATSGSKPRWLLPLVLVPRKEDEDLISEIMQDIDRAAKEIGASVIGGHTGYSANLRRPLVAVTALGTLENQEPILTKGAQIGDHILITKGVGLEGTAILANDFIETAMGFGIQDNEMSRARKLITNISVIPEAFIFAEHGATCMHDVTRGGLLEALLEISRSSCVCSQINYRDIYIPPIVSRFAKAFQFDPIKMISSGTLVVTISPEKLESTKNHLNQAGIVFRDIGEIFSGEGVIIKRGNRATTYKNIICEEDELARMWLLYKTDE